MKEEFLPPAVPNFLGGFGVSPPRYHQLCYLATVIAMLAMIKEGKKAGVESSFMRLLVPWGIVCSMLIVPTLAAWPPPNTAFVPPTCQPSFSSFVDTVSPLELAVTIASWKHDVVTASHITELPAPLKSDFSSIARCAAKEEVYNLLYFVDTEPAAGKQVASKPSFSFARLLSRLQQDAANSSHCVLLLPSLSTAMRYVDTGLVRDVLIASGVKSVRTMVITNNRLFKLNNAKVQGSPASWALMSALIGKFTAAEVLAHPCSHVMLEVFSEGHRKCGMLDVSHLGSAKARERTYRVNQFQAASFKPHYEWLVSLLKPVACISSVTELLEDTCYWLHEVHRNMMALAGEEWAYMSGNMPMYDTRGAEAGLRGSRLVKSGWYLHPGLQFLTPTAFTPPLSAAESLREGVAPIPLIGPLGLEGTGHHLVMAVLEGSKASKQVLKGIAGRGRRQSLHELLIKFAADSSKAHYQPTIPSAPIVARAKRKVCVAMGRDSTVGSALSREMSRTPPVELDPLLTMYCPGETGSLPMGMEPFVDLSAWGSRVYPSLVYLAQFGEGLNDVLQNTNFTLSDCVGNKVSKTVGDHKRDLDQVGVLALFSPHLLLSIDQVL